MNGRTEAAFSVLVGLDPLRGVAAREQATSPADPLDADTEARLDAHHRHATPRSDGRRRPARRAPKWTGAAQRRRTRYGAIGLVASAAVAVITTLLWASPSAGAPPDQAINVPTQVGQVHSPPRT